MRVFLSGLFGASGGTGSAVLGESQGGAHHGAKATGVNNGIKTDDQ